MDPNAIIKSTKDKVIVTTSAKAHRLLAKAMLASTATKAPIGNNLTRTFSLNLVATPAIQAIRQFAVNGGAKVQVDPLAEKAASQPVTLEAKDKTLPELVDMVARQAGLSVTWTKDTVTVTIGAKK